VKGYASSWSEAFLKWVLANDAITAVIPATSKPVHMHDNMRAATGRLPDERERAELLHLLDV
jgi:diketogulonate reductase-like aldo/keto reductase